MSQPDYIERYNRLCRLDPDSGNRAALAWSYCLWSPTEGALHGTLCRSYEEAQVLASDRRANGEAFADERPRHVWAAACEDGERATRGAL